MKNVSKIIALSFVMLTLTGCVKPLYDEKHNQVRDDLTGQGLTQNIVCQPTHEETINKYEEHNVNASELPKCDDINITSGAKHGFWDAVFVYPLASFIVFIGSIVKNYGLAIIIATITIRLAIWPITKKGTSQAKQMAEMQPEMKKIQAKYANKTDNESKAKMQQEVMGLYSKYNVNPLMGCITPFIQLPILLAFYEAIYRTPAIFEGTFIGLNLGLTPATAQANGNYFYLLLVVINGVTTYISTKISFSSNPQQAQQMKAMLYIMPVMISYFAYTLPTALSIYWILSNLISIYQTLSVNKGGKNE